MSVKPVAELLILGAREVLTLAGPRPDPAAPHDPSPLGLVAHGALAIAGGTVLAVGPEPEVLRAIERAASTVVIDAHDAIVAPGLLDSHTHALFVGHRAGEFGQRLRGESYAAIAGAGGGIAASVRGLRAASSDELAATLLRRLARMRLFGVSTVEVKTGYALELGEELRSIRAIREAGRQGPSRVVATGLPLHAVPPELRGRPSGRQEYLATCEREIVPALLEEGIDFLDAYVDGPGFSVAECGPSLALARARGTGVRLHVGQFEDVGGAQLAAELGAASADHLEHVGADGLAAMVRADVVGTLLPGAALSLRQNPPDARRLRAAGLELAVATDCNPGTSYTENLPLMAALAVLQQGLSVPEAWWALTRAPARSLRRPELGALRVGQPADVCVLELPTWEALPYALGGVRARALLVAGRLAWCEPGPRAA